MTKKMSDKDKPYWMSKKEILPINKNGISFGRLKELAKELGHNTFHSYDCYHYGFNSNAITIDELQKQTGKSYEDAVWHTENSAEYLRDNQGKSCFKDFIKNGLWQFGVSAYFITAIERPSIFRDLIADEDDMHIHVAIYNENDNAILIEHDKCEICGEFNYGKTNVKKAVKFDVENNFLLTIPCNKIVCKVQIHERNIVKKRAEVDEKQSELDDKQSELDELIYKRKRK